MLLMNQMPGFANLSGVESRFKKAVGLVSVFGGCKNEGHWKEAHRRRRKAMEATCRLEGDVVLKALRE